MENLGGEFDIEQLKQEIIKAVKADLDSLETVQEVEIDDELMNEIKEKIKNELRDELRNELRNELKNEINNANKKTKNSKLQAVLAARKK